MFLEDRKSDLIKQNFASDQSVAREMGITMSPSAVVYNFGCERDYGVLLEGMEALRNIPHLAEQIRKTIVYSIKRKISGMLMFLVSTR